MEKDTKKVKKSSNAKTKKKNTKVIKKESKKIENKPRYILVLVLSIINLILFINNSRLIYSIIAIVLFIFSIGGIKHRSIKAIISTLINFVIIIISIASFFIAAKEVNGVFNKAKRIALESEAKAIIKEVISKEQQGPWGYDVGCNEIVSRDLSKYDICTLNTNSYDRISITIGRDNLCIYDGTLDYMIVEECK